MSGMLAIAKFLVNFFCYLLYTVVYPFGHCILYIVHRASKGVNL